MSKTTREKIDELRAKRRQVLEGGGEKAIASQHKKGKMTARERLEILLDAESFTEMDVFVTSSPEHEGVTQFPGDGVVAGYGRIDGRPVFVYAQDFTVMGGSLGERHAEKIRKVIDAARKVGCPVIGINDSGGARIQEGVCSLAGYTKLFYGNTITSGVVPQISAIMGPCAGGAVYSPALTDFVFMVKNTSHMFLTGPNVIKEVLNEDVTFEELGGAITHNRESGVAHFAAEDEEQCLMMIRELLTFLPQNNAVDPPTKVTEDSPFRQDEKLNTIVPDEPTKPYDVKDVIQMIADDGYFFEVHPLYAANVVVGFCRLNGKPVGVIANQPKVLAGVLDINSSDKAARFIRFCDAFNIPIVTLVDVPGFLPGRHQEWGGVIRHGAKMLYAYCEATVPKITVTLRKSYGGAYCVMNSRFMEADMNFAWPTAEIAVMGAKGAVNIIHRKQIEAAKDKEKARQQLIDEYETRYNHPYIAASRGYVENVIEPVETRTRLIQALEMFATKRESRPEKKHGNIPL